MTKYKISVIIPVYNTDKKYIEQCIRSVTSQTFDSYEIILIDDGSEKSCADYCETFKNFAHVTNIVHQKNSGVSEARNNGMNLACGDYLVFIDSDDFAEKDYLDALYQLIKSCDLGICSYKNFSQEGYQSAQSHVSQILTDREKLIEAALGFNDELKFLMLNTIWGKIYKADILKENSIFFRPGLRRLEDVVFNLEYILHCEAAAYTDKSCYFYRISPASVVHSYNKNLLLDLEKPLLSIRSILNENKLYDKYRHIYIHRVFLNIMICCDSLVFSLNNNLKKKCELLKDLYSMEQYRECIDTIETDTIAGLSGKVYITLLRKKRFCIAAIFGTIFSKIK